MKIQKLIKIFNLTIFFLLTAIYISNGQEALDQINPDADASKIEMIFKSSIVPGWGQINQERLLNGFIFYGFSAIYYYRAFYNLNRYHVTHSDSRYNKFRTNLSVAVFIHLLNLIDVTDAAYDDSSDGWKGSLLSDIPPKSPWGATLRSAILPGWGQLYNESYLKAVGFLLVDGYLIYRIRQADLDYRESKSDGDRDERSRYSWYFGLAYFLTMADAYAGAHLFKFDDAMELTFTPQLFHDGIGVHCSVTF